MFESELITRTAPGMHQSWIAGGLLVAIGMDGVREVVPPVQRPYMEVATPEEPQIVRISIAGTAGTSSAIAETAGNREPSLQGYRQHRRKNHGLGGGPYRSLSAMSFAQPLLPARASRHYSRIQQPASSSNTGL